MLSDQFVQTCHEAIVEAVAFAQKDRVSASDSPELKSIAWREFYVAAPAEWGRDGPWTMEIAGSAHSVGALAVMPSTQTLFSLSQLIRPGQQIAAFGFEIMARSVLESSSRAWWIYDPKIDLRTRVARGKTVELYSVDEGVKAERAATDDTLHFAPHRERIVREAETLGLTPDYSKGGDLIGYEGQRRPDSTTIIEEMLGDLLGRRPASKAVYRLYSAIDHATVYAMIRSLTTLSTTKTTATVTPYVTNDQVANATAFAITAHLGVLSRRARLYGFNHLEIDSKRFTLCGSILHGAGQLRAIN